MRIARGFLIACVAGGIAAAPAAAADALTSCQYTPGLVPAAEYGAIGPLANGGPAQEAQTYLGAQFAGFWTQPRDLSWNIGLAPGPIDLATARAWILARVDATQSTADAAVLRDHLQVVAEPYGLDELNAVRAALEPQVFAAGGGVGLASGISCVHSGALRLEFELFGDSTAEQLAVIQALAAPYGDRVVVVREDWGPPVLVGGTLPPPVRTPRGGKPTVRDLLIVGRCAHRTLAPTVRAAQRANIFGVTITTGGRRTVFVGAVLPRKLVVKLPRRARQARIQIHLIDGTATSVTLPRC